MCCKFTVGPIWPINHKEGVCVQRPPRDAKLTAKGCSCVRRITGCFGKGQTMKEGLMRWLDQYPSNGLDQLASNNQGGNVRLGKCIDNLG